MTTSTPPPVSGGAEVDRAEIRRKLDPFVLRSVQPMGLRVLSVDDAVAVVAARELVSRQEIDRLRAEVQRLGDLVVEFRKRDAVHEGVILRQRAELAGWMERTNKALAVHGTTYLEDPIDVPFFECSHCGHGWPCPTVAALVGASEIPEASDGE